MMTLSCNSAILSESRALLTGPIGTIQNAYGEILTLLLASIESSSSAPAVSLVDQEDIAQTLNSDSQAYKRIMDRHQEHVSRIMWKFTRDSRIHQELVQDVFVEAYMSLSNYKAKAPLAHWLARVATYVGYGYWRSEKKTNKTEHFTFEEWDQVAQNNSASQLAPQDAARLLYELLAQLPNRDRLVLTLRYLEQCDVQETASRTGWSESMVKVQSWRARNKLKKLFEKNGRELEL